MGDGIDIEKGDASPAQAPTFVNMRRAAGIWRPICYGSASVMPDIRSALNAAGIDRSLYRLVSAHYGAGQHICSKACGYDIDVDGTQWIDHGDLWDESLLVDTFFQQVPVPPPPPPPAVPPYQGPLAYPPMRHSDAARMWQDKMKRRGWNISVDGDYGPGSKAVCMAFQQEKGIRKDGIVGPTTWNLTWTAPVT
jgi:peptidoglycan hydrolase-like protein with peptidoglycan-binding domain